MSERLSRNFSRDEFRCRGEDCCGGSAPIDFWLVELLQQIRDLAGVPIRVTSGFRCIRHNAAVGGAAGSLHTVGRAADIACDVLRFGEFSEVALRGIKRFGMGRAIAYADRGFIHVDLGRKKGERNAREE